MDNKKLSQVRSILTADTPTLLLHLGEMTPQEIRTVKAAFGWVLRTLLEENEVETEKDWLSGMVNKVVD